MNSSETKRIILAIQTLLGVEADGKIGPQTHAALDALSSPSPAPALSFTGKLSTFGGPHDTGVKPDEGLAAWCAGKVPLVSEDAILSATDPNGVPLFLRAQPSGTTGLARRLNPQAAYIAWRFDGSRPRSEIRAQIATLTANGRTIKACVADWGPNTRTGRVVDLSPGAALFLGVETDDTIHVSIA